MFPGFDATDEHFARWLEALQSFSFVVPTASSDTALPQAATDHSDSPSELTAATSAVPADTAAPDPVLLSVAQHDLDSSLATSGNTASAASGSVSPPQAVQVEHLLADHMDGIAISTDDAPVNLASTQQATEVSFAAIGSSSGPLSWPDQHISATVGEISQPVHLQLQPVAPGSVLPAAIGVPAFEAAPVVHAGTIGASPQVQPQIQHPTSVPDPAAAATAQPAAAQDMPSATTSSAATTAATGVGGTAAQIQAALSESGLTGAGIKIGVLSDSFNDLGGAAADEADGALPTAGSIQILKDLPSGGSDEGRAMMQVIHDIAPGAGLAFYTSDQSEQDFANGILALANAGCKVIVDDVRYFDEPFFQNGIVAQAIETVEAMGVTYVTSAGNDGSSGYQAAWTPTSGTYDGWPLEDTESFGGSLVQNVTLNASTSAPVQLLLEWDQAYGHDAADMEVVIFHNGSLYAIEGMSQVNNPDVRFQFTQSGTYQIAIDSLSGNDPSVIKEILAGNGQTITLSGANVGTVYGHGLTPGVITAAAVNGAGTPAFGHVPFAETFSSSGAGSELLFADDGTRLSSPEELNPVTVAGVDNIATTVPGNLADFFGTSAASASLAGVAALILAANSHLTSAEVGEVMQETALAMANPAVSGAGLVQANLAVSVAPLFADVAIEAIGSFSLAQAGVAYAIDAVSGATSVDLKFGGANVLVGQLGGWSPIAAEAAGSGYEVAFKMQGQDLYTVWDTDSTGNYIGNAIGSVSGSNLALEALETSFHQDLNGDGMIGVFTNTIESDGATSLVQVSNNYFLNPVSGGTGPTLQFGGAPVVAGSLSGWTPIGAEAVGAGFEVALKMQGQDLYTVWETDSSGNYVGNAISAVSGSSAALEALETSFHQDLNGDGIIGVFTNTIESDGATSLVQVANNYFLNPVGGGTGPTLQFGGSAVVAGSLSGWTPIAAETNGGGYEVALRMQGQDLYTVWNTDSSGNYIGNATGAVSGGSAALEALETSFHQDLNGDGIIGIPTTVIESNGITSLVQVANNYFLNPVGGGTGPTLQFGGAAVVAGSLSGWTPIAAETNGGGYEVALKMQGQDLYTVWNTDSSGNYIGNATAAVSGSDAALEALETSFHQDLNGDGTIGIPPSSSVAGASGLTTVKLAASGGHAITLSLGGDGSEATPLQFLGSSTPDSFHFADGGHGGALVNNTANPVMPAGQPNGEANVAALIAHGAFVFAPDFGAAGIGNFHPSTDNTVFKSVFAAQETLFAAGHNEANGGAVISDAAHDALTIAQATAAQLLTHHADFHLL